MKSLNSTGTLCTGIKPASVMTTVTSWGLETSYRRERGERVAEVGGQGTPWRRQRGEAARSRQFALKKSWRENLPISLPTILSNMMRSLNLYVSQQQMTGTPFSRNIIATIAVPARLNMLPFERRACVPRRQRETRGRMREREGRRT